MGTGGGEGNQTIDGRELWELSLSDLHKTLRTSALNGGGLGPISAIRCGSFSAAWCVCVLRWAQEQRVWDGTKLSEGLLTCLL